MVQRLAPAVLTGGWLALVWLGLVRLLGSGWGLLSWFWFWLVVASSVGGLVG